MSDQQQVEGKITWHWQTWEGLSYLTCSLLKKWPHGFFTQQFSPQGPVELVEILRPNVPAYRIKQVHGNSVLKTTEAVSISQESEGTYREADGLLSEKPEEAVWVCSADCVPVLIADSESGQVAAVHAGWRGTAAKIVPEAIARFSSSGSRLSNLLVVLGPAISGEVYQVSEEVAAKVGATITPNHLHGTNENILGFLRQLPDSPLLSDPEPGKVRLDVRRVNVLQLEQLGIDPSQVAIAPYCTYQDKFYFFSYRRLQQKKVQWSGIVSVEAS
ncbi:MAG: peptidoglycan editing factor PgeF [Cyanobacteriota bacterium]|nr:peptidoglycan editing factor PgeF [Cyanobacteriota bacterium]